MGNPVVHFEINGADAQKLAGFYGELFGWKVSFDNPMGYGLVDTDAGGKGMAGGIGRSEDGRPFVTFYVEVDDPQAALDKAESLGGRTIVPVTELPMVTFALFADPEGNVVGVVKAEEGS